MGANKSFLFRSPKKTIWVVNALKRQSFKNSGFPLKISQIRERFSISMRNQRD